MIQSSFNSEEAPIGKYEIAPDNHPTLCLETSTVLEDREDQSDTHLEETIAPTQELNNSTVFEETKPFFGSCKEESTDPVEDLDIDRTQTERQKPFKVDVDFRCKIVLEHFLKCSCMTPRLHVYLLTSHQCKGSCDDQDKMKSSVLQDNVVVATTVKTECKENTSSKIVESGVKESEEMDMLLERNPAIQEEAAPTPTISNSAMNSKKDQTLRKKMNLKFKRTGLKIKQSLFKINKTPPFVKHNEANRKVICSNNSNEKEKIFQKAVKHKSDASDSTSQNDSVKDICPKEKSKYGSTASESSQLVKCFQEIRQFRKLAGNKINQTSHLSPITCSDTTNTNSNSTLLKFPNMKSFQEPPKIPPSMAQPNASKNIKKHINFENQRDFQISDLSKTDITRNIQTPSIIYGIDKTPHQQLGLPNKEVKETSYCSSLIKAKNIKRSLSSDTSIRKVRKINNLPDLESINIRPVKPMSKIKMENINRTENFEQYHEENFKLAKNNYVPTDDHVKVLDFLNKLKLEQWKENKTAENKPVFTKSSSNFEIMKKSKSSLENNKFPSKMCNSPFASITERLKDEDKIKVEKSSTTPSPFPSNKDKTTHSSQVSGDGKLFQLQFQIESEVRKMFQLLDMTQSTMENPLSKITEFVPNGILKKQTAAQQTDKKNADSGAETSTMQTTFRSNNCKYKTGEKNQSKVKSTTKIRKDTKNGTLKSIRKENNEIVTKTGKTLFQINKTGTFHSFNQNRIKISSVSTLNSPDNSDKLSKPGDLIDPKNIKIEKNEVEDDQDFGITSNKSSSIDDDASSPPLPPPQPNNDEHSSLLSPSLESKPSEVKIESNIPFLKTEVDMEYHSSSGTNEERDAEDDISNTSSFALGPQITSTTWSTPNEKVSAEEMRSCGLCKVQFPTFISLVNHLEKHQKEGFILCYYCQKSFGDKTSMKRHMRMHTGEKPYQCKICKKRFSLPGNFKKHRDIHENVRTEPCDVCGKTFRRKEHLKYHKRTHTGEKPFKCSLCGSCFTARYSLQIHMNIHLGKRPYKCSYCGKAFCDKSTMRKHIRVHTGERPFQCNVCHKSFGESGTLSAHAATHSEERPFLCPTCPLTFKTSGGLRQHIKTHLGHKQFACKYCGMKFIQKYNMLMHERIHTREKPYECSDCSRTFRSRSCLGKHVILHGGDQERKYSCNHCDKKFFRKSHLKRHIDTHFGIKHYECNLCLKRFCTKGSLKKHIQTFHSEGARTFPCYLCGRIFKRSIYVATHKCVSPLIKLEKNE